MVTHPKEGGIHLRMRSGEKDDLLDVFGLGMAEANQGRSGKYVGSRHTGEGGDVGDAARREVLEVELERLRRVLVDMMNGLAEQVLDQIQATRRAVDQTETLLTELGSASRVDDTSTSHVHMKQVVARIEDAIRDLPESSWDDFGQACTQLARTLHRLHANE